MAKTMGNGLVKLYMALIMRDEITAMKLMTKACKQSRLPSSQVFICIDNARTEDIDIIRTHWDNYGARYIETSHACGYSPNNAYRSFEKVVNLAVENGATEEDLLYISPIDVIPSSSFHGEINKCTKNIVRHYGYKWHASAGFFFHNARNHPYIYQSKGAPWHRKERFHKAAPEDFDEWYSKVEWVLYRGQTSMGQLEIDILHTPVIQTVKRWKELGGFCSGAFVDNRKTSWDTEYIKRGLIDGAGVFSFLGVATFHHDFKKELHHQRGWK